MGSIIPDSETTWYIVFTSQDVKPHWFQKFMKKPFWHCYCFRQIGDFIYWANASRINIDTKIFCGLHASELASDLRFMPDTKVLVFKTHLDFSRKMMNIWNIAPTCVSIVKMFMGIRARAQTPYQLYKFLLKNGATTHINFNLGK